MTQWTSNASRGIIYRAVAKGQLELQSPAHFGTGEQIGTELVILRDERDGVPVLLGSSQAGAFRHYLLTREHGYRNPESEQSKASQAVATKLFGKALDKDRGDQSRIILHDALGTEATVAVRDGVKIDATTKSADDGALFQLQVWPAGTRFDLVLELYICENDDPATLKQAFAVILKALNKGEIALGARKNRGYGQARVTQWHVHEYDLTTVDDLAAWITKADMADKSATFLALADGFVDNRDRVKLKATFALHDSLMIRAQDPDIDSAHLTDNHGMPLLTGTSLAGVLRSRALKILKTYWSDKESEYLINDMFGFHGEEENKDSLAASRIRVKETKVKHSDMAYVQNRVKIDRFTGGAFETALISEQPVFATPQTTVELEIELQYSADKKKRKKVKKQTGLLLLLIKDLWTEMLPIGGESSIGRGRLKGLYATLEVGSVSAPTVYTFNEWGLEDPSQGEELQSYVNTLWEEA